MSSERPSPPSEGDERPTGRFGSDQGWPRWTIWVLFAVIAGALFLPGLLSSQSSEQISYRQFLDDLRNDRVAEATFQNTDGGISGELEDGTSFSSNGPLEPTDADQSLMTEKGVEFTTPTASIWASLLPLLIPVGLLIAFFVWMQRRAQGQMGGIMSIGRSKAKTYSTERPGTTFDDVAGYEQVKQDITEVVDFLKHPDRFAEIGARIPKGILLVGPPGTGKTLIARAVAGEAGVPFLSVTGSDFMEMFVGVGASRVRDLFQSARKMGSAIIFVDEIDSIGRKRGAGLGGGHDEREQTLNQMLAEMDGFEVTTGIVMMAATNRPDILDPALLRPGRFDRQVVVPLPELEDRRRILEVHVKHKHIAPDVDLDLVARGTPGMSGADLANLVNESALLAVRRGESEIAKRDFEEARDRILMGPQRDSMVLSDLEKEAIAYHEAGHAVCAAVLPTADPLHKVTIIPSGMALGVTMQLPLEERHIYRQDYIEDSLVVRMGGRIAEELVFGVISTGANNDLVGATELARKMVREWGMSDRVGPMAWGSQGQVFLGEDLMHTRDYSDDTARVIDEEVERILRDQQDRCRQVLSENRYGLDLVARGLLEHETIDGTEVTRLLELASPGATAANPHSVLVNANGSSGSEHADADGHEPHPPA
ncbi:ATP-dependent zinc metalloprotease FtsH [Rhabdothermincola salaria]|uniref:ATP-dependent zinc metalloprotease FtsH n=1 Tax=Rhabdothermincola salaria TaxID=2903142 RepID=UPI001E46BD73|nr:ATP-dependent zinc metalloprotease FtsH [Rhabdothermincola salaria]MCD9623332.1 ATP-dependent zinc metalloprotease FtsH [Rhabdothermincola salaria]